MVLDFGTILVWIAAIALVVAVINFIKAHWSSITHVAGVAMLVICAAWAISANWDTLQSWFKQAPDVATELGKPVNAVKDTLVSNIRK